MGLAFLEVIFALTCFCSVELPATVALSGIANHSSSNLR